MDYNSLNRNIDLNNSIEDLIKCYICFGKLNDSCMCPFCQKLACQKCLFNWLKEKKQQCPHCRSSLKESQVIKVSFMNEIASYIEKKNKTNSKEVCSKHNIQYLYYCIDCKIPLCSDCCLFEDEHKNHNIKKLNEVYMTHRDLIKNESAIIENKQSLLIQNLKDVNDIINEIVTFKFQKGKEFKQIYDNLNNQMEMNISNISFKMKNLQKDISDKVKYIDKSRKEINVQIEKSAQSELIEKSVEIIENYKKLNKSLEKNDFLFNKVDIDLSVEIPNLLTPNYEVTYFEVNNYSQLLEEQKTKNETEKNELKNRQSSIIEHYIIYSPEIRINGLLWRIKIYPAGNNSAKNEYLSIFLELIDGLLEPAKFYYKIELVNFKNKKSFYQEYNSVFSNGECWGYSKYYRLEDLEKEGFIDPQTGKLGIKIYLKNENYYQLCLDLKNYISYLEKIIEDFSNNENVSTESFILEPNKTDIVSKSTVIDKKNCIKKFISNSNYNDDNNNINFKSMIIPKNINYKNIFRQIKKEEKKENLSLKNDYINIIKIINKSKSKLNKWNNNIHHKNSVSNQINSEMNNNEFNLLSNLNDSEKSNNIEQNFMSSASCNLYSNINKINESVSKKEKKFEKESSNKILFEKNQSKKNNINRNCSNLVKSNSKKGNLKTNIVNIQNSPGKKMRFIQDDLINVSLNSEKEESFDRIEKIKKENIELDNNDSFDADDILDALDNKVNLTGAGKLGNINDLGNDPFSQNFFVQKRSPFNLFQNNYENSNRSQQEQLVFGGKYNKGNKYSYKK